MKIEAALNKMAEEGFFVSVDGDDLRIQSDKSLCDEQRAFLRKHKPELVAHLSGKRQREVHDLDRHVAEKDAGIVYWRFLLNGTTEVDFASASNLSEAFDLLGCTSDDTLEPMIRYDEPEDLPIDDDDRRYCRQCMNLKGSYCMASKRGELRGAKNHRPFDKVPRRCYGYLPGPDDPDQRPGVERWPGLAKYEMEQPGAREAQDKDDFLI